MLLSPLMSDLGNSYVKMDVEERIEGRKSGKSLGLSEFSIVWKYRANIHLFLRTFSLCKNTKYAQNNY